jgi:hypothetical protein
MAAPRNRALIVEQGRAGTFVAQASGGRHECLRVAMRGAVAVAPAAGGGGRAGVTCRGVAG